MYDFNGGGGLRRQREFKKSGGWSVSASLAVRQGFMAEPERPLPEGAQSKRQSRRIPALVKILIGGEWRRVSGDLSAGGALILLDEQLEGPEVEVSVRLREGPGAWQVKGELLSVDLRGARYGHHVRFSSPAPGLDAAIEKALAAGEKRLETA